MCLVSLQFAQSWKCLLSRQTAGTFHVKLLDENFANQSRKHKSAQTVDANQSSEEKSSAQNRFAIIPLGAHTKRAVKVSFSVDHRLLKSNPSQIFGLVSETPRR